MRVSENDKVTRHSNCVYVDLDHSDWTNTGDAVPVAPYKTRRVTSVDLRRFGRDASYLTIGRSVASCMRGLIHPGPIRKLKYAVSVCLAPILDYIRSDQIGVDYTFMRCVVHRNWYNPV